jgi:hypothetical protein
MYESHGGQLSILNIYESVLRGWGNTMIIVSRLRNVLHNQIMMPAIRHRHWNSADKGNTVF